MKEKIQSLTVVAPTKEDTNRNREIRMYFLFNFAKNDNVKRNGRQWKWNKIAISAVLTANAFVHFPRSYIIKKLLLSFSI